MPLVIALAAGATFTLLEAWIVMLLMGALHSEVPAIPSFGFAASLVLVILVNFLLIPATSGRDS